MLDESSEPRDETICRKLLRTEDLQFLRFELGFFTILATMDTYYYR